MFAEDKQESRLWVRYKKTLTGLVLAFVLGLFYMFWAGAAEVHTVRATRGNIAVTVDEIGYIQADDEYDVLAPVSGYVGRLTTERGHIVQPLQEILLLDSPETDSLTETIQAEVNRVAASLNEAASNNQIALHELADAEKKLSQKKTLLAVGAISQQEYDDARLALDRLRSRATSTGEIIVNLQRQLAALQKQHHSTDRKRNQLSVKSPVAGTVIYLLPKQGEYVAHGTIVAKIGKTGRTRVNVDVLSDNMGQVALGQKVTVNSPVLPSPVSGIISTIYPQAFEKISPLGVNQRRVRVIADLPEWGNLKSGYEVRISILSQFKQDALLIPRQALNLSPQGDYEVWLVTAGRVERRKVMVGLKNRLHVEILKGLEPQDQVVTVSKTALNDKMRVRSVD